MSAGAYFAESFQYGPAGVEVVGSGSAPSILRARILLHLLFTDRLVIPDSQILNNTHLRSLLWLPESEGFPPDLGELLADGRLAVARRDNLDSLSAVRGWQVANRMPDVPSPEYAEFIDEISADGGMEWNFEDVSSAFKDGTLRSLRAHRGISSIDDRVLDLAILWVERQEVLYYNRFLSWRAQQNHLDQVAVDRVNRAITVAYGLSLPKTLGLDYAGPANEHSPIGHVIFDQPDGASAPVVEATCFAINPFVLAQLPVPLVLEAVEGPHRQSLMRLFAAARSGEQPDWNAIGTSFYGLMEDLNAATIQYLRHQNMTKALDELHALRPKAKLTWLIAPIGETASDIALDVVTGGLAGGVAGALARLGLLGFAVHRARASALSENLKAQESARRERRLRLAQGMRPDERLIRPPTGGRFIDDDIASNARPKLSRFVAEPARVEDDTG